MMDSGHRPPSAWLTQLQRAKVENARSSRPKTTIQDVAERANVSGGGPDADPHVTEGQLIPTSPRSIEACCRLGIDPLELAYKPPAAFVRPGEPRDLSEMRYQHHEALRQERIHALIDERKKLAEGAYGDSSSGHGRSTTGTTSSSLGFSGAADTSAMIEKEKHKLEVLKRRQERDIQQMLQYEVTRKALLDKQQKKIDAMEARAAELRQQKLEREKQWAVAQRARELQKLAEEQERDKEAVRAANERYRREKERQAAEERAARQRKKEAYQREMEIRAKMEESRQETERILAQQAAELRAKKAEMDRRDRERLARMAREQEERAIQNAIKKKQAEERIQNALKMNSNILAAKRAEFESKEAAAEVRRREKAVEEAAALERKLREEAEAAAERQAKYQLALEREEARKQNIRDRASAKDEMLGQVYQSRDYSNTKRRIEKELHDSLRRDKVESIQKMQAYQRQLLLERIMADNEKTAQLLAQREAIQEQRRAANMTASLHRHRVNQLMESMKNVKVMEKLAPGGTVDLGALTAHL